MTRARSSQLSLTPKAQSSFSQLGMDVAELSPDEEINLITQAQDGSKVAFTKLFELARPRLLRLCQKKGLQPADAEDMLQDVAISCLTHIKNFRKDSQFATWAYIITLNRIKNHLTSTNRHDVTSCDATQAAWTSIENNYLYDRADPPAVLTGQQTLETLCVAIEALPNDLRTAFCLREFGDLSYDSIAAQMDTPTGTVRSRIFRAREMVDTALAQSAEPQPYHRKNLPDIKPASF